MTTDREVFNGGVAVVTGAGAGLGEGLARRAAELGMKVVLADVDRARIDALARELQASGADIQAIPTDVSRPTEIDALAAQVHGSWGDVRLLVNNAGIETIGYSWEIPADRWEKTLDINLHGVIHGVRAFAPRMLEAGKPAYIANLASIGAFGQMPLQTAYMVTKHAIQAFSECLYLEMQLTGKPVHVASIIPGMVKTRIFEPAGADAGETPIAARHRQVMRELMATGGMDLATACRGILERVAAGDFWISTQPEMTEHIIAGRIEFLRNQSKPTLTEVTKELIQG